MKQSELIAAMAAELGVSKVNAEAIFAAQALIIRTALKVGDDVPVPGLGKLSTAQREAREARNPATGGTVQVPAKTVVKFKPSKSLADAIA